MTMIAVLGLLGCLAMTLLYLGGVSSIADTSVQDMEVIVHGALRRSLVADHTTTRITMSRDGKGLDAPRTYTLRMTPNPAVASDPAAVRRLLVRGAEVIHSRLGPKKPNITIQVVASLPAGESEVVFQRSGDETARGLVEVRARQPQPAPAPAPVTAPAPGTTGR